MRDFNEADLKKKKTRIRIQENPGNLSMEVLLQLKNAVKASLKDGYLPCPVAWKIAKEANIPKVAIGEITDRLGIRLTNCQIGFFRREKTPYDNSIHKNIDGKITTLLKSLNENNKLTCAQVFALAKQFKLTPMIIANEANAQHWKIHNCQLGCF